MEASHSACCSSDSDRSARCFIEAWTSAGNASTRKANLASTVSVEAIWLSQAAFASSSRPSLDFLLEW
jgi:hypothetical protein